MIHSIDEALRTLDAIEPKRFYLRQTRIHHHPILPDSETWHVHDSRAVWNDPGCTTSEILGEAVALMIERVKQKGGSVMELANYREYRTADKSTWGHGQWHQEPDKVQWIDPATGLDCLIVRGPSGALCGYVGVPETHPFHGKDYSDIYDHDIECHGGLTFSDSCAPANDKGEAYGICHVPAEGRPDHVWWFGFDCAHSGDLCPKFRQDDFGYNLYRDIDYVKAEVGSLAAQLAAIK